MSSSPMPAATLAGLPAPADGLVTSTRQRTLFLAGPQEARGLGLFAPAPWCRPRDGRPRRGQCGHRAPTCWPASAASRSIATTTSRRAVRRSLALVIDQQSDRQRRPATVRRNMAPTSNATWSMPLRRLTQRQPAGCPTATNRAWWWWWSGQGWSVLICLGAPEDKPGCSRPTNWPVSQGA